VNTKTNPAYAELAWRRAIVVQLMDDLRENYLALSSSVPKKTIICEDVFREDSVVPEHALSTIYEELEREAENLKLELGKFSFGKVKEAHGLLSSKETEASREQHPEEGGEEGSGGEGQGKKRRRRARRR
jgi:hypothetical protein